MARPSSSLLLGAPLLVLALAFALPGRAPAQEARGVVSLTLTGVEGATGRVACGLYRPEDDWLHRDNFRGVLVDVRGSRVRCTFRDVPAGRYAISAIHDEDSDGEFDRGVFGIPREGWAASNDAHLGRLGPPRYDAARFDFDGSQLRLTARMRY
ncbi:MAG TPA: DUF2141 domain-containing protein [Polyangiaceae bacterium LLY-WYZ-15_(1-7)]|nr:hypothetical protein [Myxococcales bacterium]MAT27961.1 hypothetical protein [Sandaracinus sp.]HJK93187.1 DUF2141 domain-containing protein [Polyangiaceae bacterium LLY-WYZ-15_(1-7)]MAC28081.1 hypothetical protein [Myxococcales bacterium]MBJ71235.1 hypothetical protein [Sandaracinus sp.]